jgi:hypothetical protein
MTADSNQHPIDGDSTLQEQEDSLNYAQNLLRSEVTAYVKGGENLAATGGDLKHPNFPTFTKVEPPKDVHLVSPGATPNPKPGAGQKQVFDNQVWVGGVITRVIGYRSA